MSSTSGSGKLGATHPEMEEPLTQTYYTLARKIANAVKINPNIITLTRLVLMIGLTALFYMNRLTVLAALLLQVCFFLDHLDGEMARTHNMITKFGDYFDHILDVTYEVPLVVILLWKLYATPLLFPIVIALAAVLYISTILVACQEIILEREQKKIASQSLQGIQRLCPRGFGPEHIKYIKYFGQSFLHLGIGAAMIYANW